MTVMNRSLEYLIFLPVCMLIKGYKRSIVLDIQRGILDFIPNDLYEIYQKYNKCKIDYILNQYNKEEQIIVQEYIDFLIKNEYAILGSEHDAKHITDLPIQYNYYGGSITNCICEYSKSIFKNIQLILRIVDEQLKCSAFQLICIHPVSITELVDFMRHFKDMAYISHVEIILPYHPEYTVDSVDKFIFNNPIINKLILYSSPFDLVKDLSHTIIINTHENISKTKCGIVKKEYFAQNIFHITEAMHYNTCLHKKLFISGSGDIKNCPYSKKIHGNILIDDVQKIIEKHIFRKLWSITKDKIAVCKDCEFRYICTDCRVFIKDTHDMYSPPMKCTYNPYIAKWAGEEEYQPVAN